MGELHLELVRDFVVEYRDNGFVTYDVTRQLTDPCKGPPVVGRHSERQEYEMSRDGESLMRIFLYNRSSRGVYDPQNRYVEVEWPSSANAPECAGRMLDSSLALSELYVPPQQPTLHPWPDGIFRIYFSGGKWEIPLEQIREMDMLVREQEPAGSERYIGKYFNGGIMAGYLTTPLCFLGLKGLSDKDTKGTCVFGSSFDVSRFIPDFWQATSRTACDGEEGRTETRYMAQLLGGLMGDYPSLLPNPQQIRI